MASIQVVFFRCLSLSASTATLLGHFQFPSVSKRICPWTCTLSSLYSFSFPLSLKSALSFTAHTPTSIISRHLSAAPRQIPDLLFMQKTEAMIVSSGRKSWFVSASIPDSMTIGCASVLMSDSVRNFCIALDCHLTMKTHISSLVRSSNLELPHNSSIRHMSTDATKLLCMPLFLPALTTAVLSCPAALSVYKRFRTTLLALS